MVTIRSYTTIEQSRKLAEILPLESADMFWLVAGNTPRVHVLTEPLSNYSHWENYHCWSLAALFGALPKIGSEEPMIQKLYYANNSTERYICQYSLTNMTGEYDNPVDACYEMIIKFHELNLL